MNESSLSSVRCPGGGKVTFNTREAAKEALRRMKRWHADHGRHLDDSMHVYECQKCSMWHLGRDRWNRDDQRKERP
jgi:hypothetical protein